MTTREIRELSRAECLDLLGRAHLGRLGFIDSVGVFPIVVPVNYVLYDGSVVFRVGPGAKLAAAVRGADVAFEVDQTDDSERTGWSVLVRGTAEELVDSDELAELKERHLQPWAPGAKRHYVRINSNLVSGRRIDLDTAAGPWWEPADPVTDAAPPTRVVVGVDGSWPARAALQWAARYARATEAVLHAVRVLDWPIRFVTASANGRGNSPGSGARSLVPGRPI